MFKTLTTLQRILICVGLVNFVEFCLIGAMIVSHNISDHDYLVVSGIFGFVNFVWVYFLLRKSFNAVENVAIGLNSITTSKHKVYYKDTPHLINEGHQQEITDLVQAFNHLVDDIHENAEESKKIIGSVSKNGD